MLEFHGVLIRDMGTDRIDLKIEGEHIEDRLSAVAKYMEQSGRIFRLEFKEYCHSSGTIKIALIPDNGVGVIGDSSEIPDHSEEDPALKGVEGLKRSLKKCQDHICDSFLKPIRAALDKIRFHHTQEEPPMEDEPPMEGRTTWTG